MRSTPISVQLTWIPPTCTSKLVSSFYKMGSHLRLLQTAPYQRLETSTRKHTSLHQSTDPPLPNGAIPSLNSRLKARLHLL